MKTQGITRRVKPVGEVWYLRIKNEETISIKTINKRERNMLNSIRKILMAYDIKEVDLTNRKKYIKNVKVSQEKREKMKMNNSFDYFGDD